MATDPFEQARRERSLLRGLWELSPLGQVGRLASDYKSYADRERASDSLMGDYLTALSPIEDTVQGASSLVSAPFRGLSAAAAYGQDLLAPEDARRVSVVPNTGFTEDLFGGSTITPTLPQLALEGYKAGAQGLAGLADPSKPGALAGEDVTTRRGTQLGYPNLSRAEAIAEPVADLGLQFATDPSLALLGPLGRAGEVGRGAEAALAATFVPGAFGSAIEHGNEFLQQGQEQGYTSPGALRAGAQGLLETGMGAMMASHAASGLAPSSISERVALKREAKAQGMDDVPQPQPVPQQAPVPQPVEPMAARNEPQPMPVRPSMAAEPARMPERAQEPLPEPLPYREELPIEQPQDLAVAPEAPEADIPTEPIPQVEPPATKPVPFQFPLDEVAAEARPQAEAAATALATRFAETGRFDQAALDEAVAADPSLAPHAEAIKSQSVQEAAAITQGRDLLDDMRSYHEADGPDGVERVPIESSDSSYDLVQRKDGQIIGAAQVRDGELKMVAGGRKMGSPESIRPVYEALDAAGATRNDQLTVLGAQARRNRAASETGPVSIIPSEAGEAVARPEPRAGDAGRIQPQAAEPSRHPLERDEPLPVQKVIDQTRQRLAQHERTRAPEHVVANDLGSAVYHVVASGLKRTLPQVRGWVKRQFGTWLRKVGFAGEKLNGAIGRAYEAAQARFRDYRARLADPLSDSSQRGSTSSVAREGGPVMSREEIDRQLRSNPELRGMARAQLESIAQSAGKPMARLNTEDIGKALPGNDPQSRASRALLNRVAAAERLAEPVDATDELTSQLEASLKAPKAGRKVLDNPRSKSGKVREEPVHHSLPEPTRKAVEAHEEKAKVATGSNPVLKLSDLDEGVRGALKLRTDADLKRMLHGRTLTQSEAAAFKLTLQDQKAETLKHQSAWRAADTDKARAEALGAYLDSQLKQAANLRAFAGDTPSAARIEKARSAVKDTDAVRKLFASLRPETRATISDSQAAKLSLLMRETMEGRRPASELGEAIQAATKATPLDKVLEWWKAGLLSGPPTHIANLLGNTTNLLLDLAKTGVAGAIDAVASKGNLGSPKKARERYVSDVGASLHGMMGAIGPAFRAFGREMGDMATLKPEKFDLNAGRYEHQVGAIKGVKGRIIRSPFRALGAVDGFVRALLNASEQFKEANRAVERRIETGDVDRADKHSFMADWMEKLRDPANAKQFEAVKDRIEGEVKKGLFQQDADELTRYVQRVLHTPVGKLGQFFVPFISTPVNILKTTARYTPAGAIAARLRANRLVDATTNAHAIDDMAKGVVGTVIGAGLLGLAQQGAITGSGPTDPRERVLKEKTGWKPKSLVLNLGGHTYYVPVDRIEPLGTLMGLVGDVAELEDEKKSGDAFSKVVGMVKDNVLSKSYLEGLSNLFELISDPERHGASFLRSFAGSWVPSISGRLAQGLDPVVRDTKGDGDSPLAKIADSVRKSMQAKIPGASQLLEARRDATGAPQTRSGNAFTRMLMPSSISEAKQGPEAEVAQELLRVGHTPGEPRRDMTIQGRKIDLTTEEYSKLQDAQEAASKEVHRVMQQPSYQRLPDSVEEGGQASKEAVIKRIYDGYRDRARNDLYRTPRLAKERRRAEAQRMPNVRINFGGR